jgi:hypothetical protein
VKYDSLCVDLLNVKVKERLPALVRDLFTFSSKVIKVNRSEYDQSNYFCSMLYSAMAFK